METIQPINNDIKVIGVYKYDKKDKIGQGVFGKVFKGHTWCEKTKSKKIVAIKRVNLAVLKCYPKSIKRETFILKKLSDPTHRNIVTLLHSEQQGEHMYFIMEYYNGGNLADYLQSKQKLDEHTLNCFLRQIAAGLRAAHNMQIVHRDLKPANILLCFSGLKYPDPLNITLKIADFGIGRVLGEKEMARTLCGTQLYMAPEVSLGRPYDYKVDLWSIGVIAFECIVGSLPSTERSMATQDFEIPTNISANCADLLKGLLEKDETKRFDTDLLFDHPFLDATISLSIRGLDNGRSVMIQVEDKENVDHLSKLISTRCNTGSEAVLLLHEDGRPLENGVGNSLRRSGIIHNSTITLALRLSGGNDKDGQVATNSSSSVSS